jgi:hypothetical protein
VLARAGLLSSNLGSASSIIKFVKTVVAGPGEILKAVIDIAAVTPPAYNRSLCNFIASRLGEGEPF